MLPKFFTAFISSFLLLSFVNGQSPIPPGYKCADGILVVIKPDKKSTIPNFETNIKRQFKKHYAGKYEIVTAKELETESRFQDKKTYRYSMNYQLKSDVAAKPGTTDTYISRRLRLRLTDRESGEEYRYFGEGRNTVESIQLTAKALGGTCK